MRTRILLIEDGHAGRSVLTQLFGLSGMTVYAFSSVEEASDQLKTGTFDVALLDGDLPREEGIVAAEELSSRCPSMRVVVMLENEASVMAIQNRCPEILVAAKSMVSEGVMSRVGVGAAAICNN